MIRRYSIQSRARWGDDLDTEIIEIANAMTVFEPAPVTRHTGLVTASGDPIMVSECMGPIGFTHFDDE